MKKQKYESEIIMGDTYRDKQTGVQGIATAVTFFQHACVRVDLEVVNNGDIKLYGFDAPRLEHVSSASEPPKTERAKTGGPGSRITTTASRR